MAASWIDQYQQGSFRGIEFFISTANNTTGRRIASHKFPDRDQVYHQDLGRAERSFTFDAYVIGDDYFQHRENLIAACEQEGPGKLIHPYRGEFQVVCKVCEIRETTAEGRMVRFSLEFSEQKTQELTATGTDTATSLAESLAELVDDQKEMFDSVYSIASLPARVAQDAIDVLNAGLDAIEQVKRITGTVAEFQQAVQTIKGKVLNAVLDGAIIADDLNLLVSFGTDPFGFLFPATAANAAAQYLELRNLWGAKTAEPTGTSPVIFDDPDYPPQKIQKFLAYNAAINSTGLVSVYPLGNVEDAEALRTEIFETLDEISEDQDTTDEMFASIRDLRQAVTENLDTRILNLSSVAEFVLPENRTTLNVANEFYGDSAKEEGFISLNNILHPGMVPAAVTLKVEVDAAG